MRTKILSILILFMTVGLGVEKISAQNINAESHHLNNKAELTFLGRRVVPSVYQPGLTFKPSARRTMSASGSEYAIPPMPAAAATQVSGSGTVGRLSKWTGLTSTSSILGNSTIFEDKFGMVGIGTDAPTSRLTVAGMIHSLSGGYKFPDGTIQTTAGIAPNLVVRSLNGLMGDLTLMPGANITITPGANSLTFAATGLLSTVAHDATLAGNGTATSPLGIALPLSLTGATPTGNPLVLIHNTGEGSGMNSVGANNPDAHAGTGVSGRGGISITNRGGTGVRGSGGDSDSATGGDGMTALGGNSNSAMGGWGLTSFGGNSVSGTGGIGIQAMGGSVDSGLGGGGTALTAFGGDSIEGFGGVGLFGSAGTGALGNGLAGKFAGDVEINGDFNVTGVKNFKIDHPLDPANKYLYHAAIESSEVLNVYSGNVITDAKGEVVVNLPDWFEALNRDLRYQLTVIGTFAQAIVAEKVRNNRFTIKTNAPGIEVSWQVTGVRSDVGLKRHPFKVEQDKPERERGTYLSPEAFNQPEELGVEWARQPEVMKQRKAVRQKAKLP
jgi:trimeric autotransporter adhesin